MSTDSFGTDCKILADIDRHNENNQIIWDLKGVAVCTVRNTYFIARDISHSNFFISTKRHFLKARVSSCIERSQSKCRIAC